MTPPLYPFTACGADYEGMDAVTKDALHQLVNTAGARLERDVEMWERELREDGWRPRRTNHTVWRSLDGDLFRGPYGAWKEMKRRKG